MELQGCKVECKVCGNRYYKITISHIKKHGMTRQEYLDKFPEESKNFESNNLRYAFNSKVSEAERHLNDRWRNWEK